MVSGETKRKPQHDDATERQTVDYILQFRVHLSQEYGVIPKTILEKTSLQASISSKPRGETMAVYPMTWGQMLQEDCSRNHLLHPWHRLPLVDPAG